MKFLIAASLVCFAFIGQAQGGSLRGYTYSVPVPHVTYGVPLEVSRPIVEDVPTITVQQPIVPQSAVESSAPVVVPEIHNIPLVDSLPFVESAANFVIPSQPQLPAVAPQPELPYLQPGLPTLPQRPVVPVVVKAPLSEVQNSYLPPVRETSGTPVTEASYPGDVAPDAEVIENAAIPTAPVNEVSAQPQISEIPALPAAPVTPSTPVAPKPSETYGPPAVQVPHLAVHTTVATETPAVPHISQIPALSAAPVAPSAPAQVYKFTAAPVTPYVPVTATPTPSSVYGPPAVAYEVPATPQIAEIPALPAAPVTPSVPVQVYEVPAAPETPQATGTPSFAYRPSTVAYELPTAPQIAEIPAHPAAQVKPSVPAQVYKFTAAPVTPYVPVTATPTPSSVYGPPAVAYEVPATPQIAEIPALPAAPVTPSVPVQVYEVPAAPETPQATGTPSLAYRPSTVANELPTAPQIAEIPAHPAAQVNPSVPAQVYKFTAAPVTPYVPVTATPTPSSVYGPPAVAYEVPATPQIAEIPALPAAPVIPSANELPTAPQIAQIPSHPAAPVIPAVQVYKVPAAPESPQAIGTPSSVYGRPIVAYELPAAPQIAGIPALPAGPVIPSVHVYEVQAAPVVHILPSIEKSGQAPEATAPSTPLTVPTGGTHTFSVRPIVSQIINFASSFLPVGEESYTASPEAVASPAEVPIKAGYPYKKPAQAFPTPGSVGFETASSGLGAASVSAQVPEAAAVPAEIPTKSGYDYKKPVKGFSTPVSVGLLSQSQNSASSLSSSSIHVNHVVLPSYAQAPGSTDAVFVEQLQPSGSGFTIQSASENTAQTSAGNFNQVSFIQHGLPQIPPITSFVGVGAPHSVFAAPSF